MYLNCHTYFSLNHGLLSVDELIASAKRQGVKQLALTDINNTSCTIEFVEKCLTADIRPVLGIEFRQHHRFYYVGIAKNRQGYRRLNEFLNRFLVNGVDLPEEAPSLEDTLFIYDFLSAPGRNLGEQEFVGVRPQHVNLWLTQRQFSLNKAVCLIPITFRSPDQWDLHRLVSCIDRNTILSKLPLTACCHHEEYFRDEKLILEAYATCPNLIRNANHLLDQCTFTRDRRQEVNLSTYDDRIRDHQQLTQIAYLGLLQRFGAPGKQHLPRLERELRMIQQLNFTGYFLITWDIVQFAKRRNYRHVGRGSGANSLVAYCLHITDVDPIALNLYFERFINPHRPVPPDFDLDFSWDERDEIVKYLQQRHGHDRVGILATYQTYKGKSVVREVGKALGLNKGEIDQIISQPLAIDSQHTLAEQIFRKGKGLLNLPSHLSIHAGGVVIGSGPIAELTASQMMPKGLAITQFDMHHAAQWGLHKYDILSQRGTGHIKEAVEIIRMVRKDEVDISDMATVTKDVKTLSLLASPGGCIGCFYIESPAMRGLLTKVPCRNYLDLVAVSSIIRPGVAKSGMMQKYIERFHDPTKVLYLHPIMHEMLSETYGIMVYQEDVMKVAHHLGKFDLYEADLLRRLMTGKKKSATDLHQLRDRFLTNVVKQKIRSDVAQELWRQIESFSGYAFCKAHSATYAAESMQSLYLKANYPIEFMVAVINNDGGFYPMEVYIRELMKLGGKVELPCIVNSTWLTRINKGKIYLGLKLIRGIAHKTGEAILQLRREQVDILDLPELVERIGPAQLDLLILAGALRHLDGSRYRLLFERILISNPGERSQMKIFRPETYHYTPEVSPKERDEAIIQMRSMGFTIDSPYQMFPQLPRLTMEHLKSSKNGDWVKVIGYYILEKPVTTESGAHMCFITWYDQDLTFFDTVHFSRVIKRFPVQGKGVYLIEGIIDWAYGCAQIEARTCKAIQLLDDSLKSNYTLSDYEYLRLTNG